MNPLVGALVVPQIEEPTVAGSDEFRPVVVQELAVDVGNRAVGVGFDHVLRGWEVHQSIFSALIMVPQVVVAIMAPWTGRQANMRGRRPLLLVGFAALPIRALVFAWTTNPTILIVAQLLDGVSGAVLGVLTALTVADLTAGTGRFNLAQGFLGTISGIGASLSTTLIGLVAGSFGPAAGFLCIAALALAALFLLWWLMPETHPSNRS